MARALRPPSLIAVQPLALSQRNVEQAMGIPAWKYLQLVAENNIAHRRIGKLVVTEAPVFVDAVLRTDQLSSDDSSTPEPRTVDEEADRVLASIGRRRAS